MEKFDKFTYKSSRKHLKYDINGTHSGITFYCDKCEKAFAEKRGQIQFVNETFQFFCNKCTIKGNTQGHLENHILWIL